MLQRIISLLSGKYNEKELKKLRLQVEKINDFYEQYNALTDTQIQAKTPEFKERIQKGESLDDILPEAFAIVKQACRRLEGTKFLVKGEEVVWNMVPYDVQLIGGIVLHTGRAAEMKTGEGKTLVASLPAYLNALAGKGVHVITVNDYLAARDADWMKPLYEWLGLSLGVVVKGVDISQRKAQYEADITYVENSELGFDYLRDNLVKSINQRVLARRPLNYAIVDEIDSILIDEARTPLIISEPDQEATDKYTHYAKIVKTLKASKLKKKVSKGFLQELINDKKGDDEQGDDGDYYIDTKTKTVSLNSQGIEKLEGILGVKNLYQDFGYQEIHHIENALKANAVYDEDKDYLINDGQILIIDQNTGRAMQGRRFGEGLHQAIEAKHNLVIQRESKTLATVTYQNFFKLYEKLSGMTGTASTEGEEFDTIYGLDVLVIPTNKPILRVDQMDKVYFNQKAKWNHILEHVKFAHTIGQPILIGTSSITTSEFVSQLLQKNGLVHSVLNAKYHEKEAHIVANAGKLKSIMVATNMAGRGTDIKLEKGLNETLATNYATWTHKALEGKLAEQSGPNTVSAVMFSSKEFEYTLDAFTKQFDLNDDIINAAATSWTTISGGHTMKIVYNKRKKKNHQAHAEIILRPSENQSADMLNKNFHYGLAILGTEKHESRRIDNQLRGRAGRQGDPGISVFYVALDDSIMEKMGGTQIQSLASMLIPANERETIELTQRQFSNSIERAQKQMEGWHFGIRKHLFDYDSVINKQRVRIYEKRDQMLFAMKDAEENLEEITAETSKVLQEIEEFVQEVITSFIHTHRQLNTPTHEMIDILKKEFNLDIDESFFKNDTYATIHEHLTNHIKQYLTNSINGAENKILVQNIITRTYLNIIDRNWIEHIDNLAQLRDQVGLMGYAKQDPLIVYKQEAFDKFQALLINVKQATLSSIMNTDFAKIQEQQSIASQRAQQRNSEMLHKLEGAAQNITFVPENPVQAQSNFHAEKTSYTDEDGTEVFEINEEQIANKSDNSQMKKKLRPNDKVAVRYSNGKVLYDVKYKKVEQDILDQKCQIIG